MRQRDENFVSMTMAVKNLLDKHQEVWGGMERFARAKASLDKQIAATITLNGKSSIKTNGATKDKTNARKSAAELAAWLCARVQVYAKDRNDMDLYWQCRHVVRDFMVVADGDALTLLQDVHSRMLPLLTETVAYGVGLPELEKLQGYITAYGSVISRPRDLQVLRKGYHAEVRVMLSEIRGTLRVLDKLINLWAGTPLEQGYWNARIIVDLGGRRKNKETE